MHTPRGTSSRPDRSSGRSLARNPATLLRSLWLLLATLAFTGAALAQSLSPGGPVDFGSVPLGNNATPTTLTFSVPAGHVVTVGSIIATTDGATGKDFTISSQTCVGTIAGPATCTITVAFKPSILGLRLGELFIEDGTGTVTNRVPLRGAGLGPQMVLSPSAAVATTTATGLSPAAINPSSTVFDGNGNLFIDDAINGRILERDTTGVYTVVGAIPASPPGAPFSSITITGDGTLYISSPSTGTVYSLPPGGTATPLPITGVSLGQPTGLAVDGFGYLYVADAANNDIVRVDLENGDTAVSLTLTGLGTPLAGPEGLSVDDADILFVADATNNRIVSIDLHTTVGLTNPATVVPLTGETLSSPAGVVVNAAGGLTIADTGNSRLIEAPLTGSAFPLALTGATLTTPAGVTLLPNGDLLVSDTAAGLVQITRSTSSLTFPTSTLYGTVDTTDGDLAVTVENTGSYPLQFPSAQDPTASGNAFFIDTSTCPVTTTGSTAGPGTQIAVGSACQYEFGFKPTVKGINTSTDTITATAVGGTDATVSTTVLLTGTGYVELSYFTLTVSPSTVNPGQATTLTVTAYNNDNSLDTTYTGTITLSSTDATATLPAGAYTFTAADNGVHVFSSASPTPLTFNTLGTWTVTAVDTATIAGKTITGTSNLVTVVTTPTVNLTSSVNPVDVDANTLLTATVASTYGTPTGTVTFLDGATVLGTGTLNASGIATLSVSFSTAGQHTLTVSYPGVGFFLAATSAPLIETVSDYTPTIAFTSSVNPVNVNATTLLTATLTSPSGTPTGVVTFLDGATVLGTGTLNAGGVATLNVSFSTPGQHTLTVTYPGNGPYLAATSAPLIETVDQFTPAISLASSVNPIMLGNITQLTAALTSASGTPTGTVTFLDGTTVLGTAVLSSGVATLNVSFTTVGQHSLTVTYPGNGFFQGGTSAPLIETVGDFSLTIAPSSPTSASILLGGSAPYNLIVAPVGTSTLAGPVTLSVLGLPDGASATFAPSTVPAASGSTPVVMTVNAPPLFTSSLHRPAGTPFSHHTAPALLALLLIPIGAFARRRKPLIRLLVLLVGLGAASTGLTGCLSDSSKGYYGQPPETYTLIVSGTSGQLVHTVQVSLTVE
jgi:sugar lactone lactonase YvrE